LLRYLSSGIRFVTALDGEFNIVIWDEREGGRVWLANDRYGLRPLQYALRNGDLYFAPQGAAVLAGTGSVARLDMDTVVNWLSVGRALLGTRTFFRGVDVLPPASLLEWHPNGTTRNTRYWDYIPRPRRSSEDKLLDQLVATFKRAIEKRIKPRLRYGVCLSGGLDSRMVAAGLAAASRSPALACTWGLRDSDEVSLAAKVAARLGMPWKLIPLGPRDFVKFAVEGVRLTEGLDLFVQSYGMSVFPAFRKDAQVALSGLALDVLLGGSYLERRLFDSGVTDSVAAQIVRRKLTYFDADAIQQLFQRKAVARRADDLFFDSWESAPQCATPAAHAEEFVFRYRVSRMLFHRQTWQRSYMEDMPPTFDNALVDLIIGIPAVERANHKIYQRFMWRMCPNVMDIAYQRTLVPPSVPVAFWNQAAAIEAQREALYREIWRASGATLLIPYKRYSTNYEEWFSSSPEWIALTNELLLARKARLADVGVKGRAVARMVEEQRKGLGNHRQRLIQLMTLELLLRGMFA
jgi:asparagine synthase (glutamine-hydrolysing)